MKQAKQCQVLVVGATFAGLGLACGLGRDTLIVEKTGAVGHEFTSALRKANVDLTLTVSPATTALQDEAVKRNIIGEDGGIHWPAFVPVLHQLIYKEKLKVRFLTRIIEVTVQPNGSFEVMLMDAAGLSKVHADRIVDTTSFCDSAPDAAAERLREKRLNAVIYRPDAPDEEPPLQEGYAVYKGRFASEWVTGCPLGLEDDWAAARAQLLSYWSSRPESLHPWLLVTIADAFDVTLDMRTDVLTPEWLWHPSASYSDPTAAFDAGIQFQMEVPLK